MEIGIIEVTNSMSPQGIYIGSATEVAAEIPSSTDTGNSSFPNCGNEPSLTSSSDQTIGLTLSPTSNIPLEDLSDDDLEVSSFSLDDHNEDAIIDDYSKKLDLAAFVIKGLTHTDKNALDILSVYDNEKTGCLSVAILKKCLAHHSLRLSEQDFNVVFEGFIKNNEVNYIDFLKAWSCIIEPDWCCPQKRSCPYDELDGIGYSAPKRRLIAPSPEDYQLLQSQIGRLLIRHFGNSQGIFKELAVNDVLYVSDFYKYLAQNQIACTLGQLTQLLQPFCGTCAFITIEEFQEFAKSLTCTRTSEQLVEAFPNTFGCTTHISMNKNILHIGKSRLHRTPSVAQNLNRLHLYRLMLNINDESHSSQEEDEDAVFV